MKTANFECFGHRELAIASKLLNAYLENNHTKLLGSKISIGFNENSGYVFIIDEYFNVAMLSSNDDGEQILVDLLTCPQCGHESISDDFLTDSSNCCKEYLVELGFSSKED